MLSCYEIRKFFAGVSVGFPEQERIFGYLKTAQEVNHIQMPGSLDKREHPDSVENPKISENTEYPEIKELQKLCCYIILQKTCSGIDQTLVDTEGSREET